VVQGSGGSGFLFKSPQPIRIVADKGRQYFDGNVALQSRIAGAVDFSHSAGSQRRLDFVWPEFSARGKSHQLAQL
jgi:hypothetical protein